MKTLKLLEKIQAGTRPYAWITPAAVMVLGLLANPGAAPAEDSPDFLRYTKVDSKPPAASEVARDNVLVLDTAMMAIYEDNLAQFKKNLLGRTPVIVALF